MTCVTARRVVQLLLILLGARLALPTAALADAGANAAVGRGYATVSFDELVAAPETFQGKKVCIKGGWVHDEFHYIRNILVPVDRINKPFKCQITVERYIPAAALERFARIGRTCARAYGRWFHPQIILADFPGEIDISPELCVVACGVATAERFPGGYYYEKSIRVEKIHPCK